MQGLHGEGGFIFVARNKSGQSYPFLNESSGIVPQGAFVHKNDGSAFVGSRYFSFFLILTVVLTSGSSHGCANAVKYNRSVRHGEVSGNTPIAIKRSRI